jgi:ferrous iron transport protein A
MVKFTEDAARKQRLLTLDELPPGMKARVVSLATGTRALRRLAEMGLTPGTTVEVLMDYGGPILVKVRGAVIAIGRGMARKILVEPV